MRLEKMINPLLDDDDLTALTYIFSEIMEKNIKSMQVSHVKLFHNFSIKKFYYDCGALGNFSAT